LVGLHNLNELVGKVLSHGSVVMGLGVLHEVTEEAHGVNHVIGSHLQEVLQLSGEESQSVVADSLVSSISEDIAQLTTHFHDLGG